MLVRDVIEQSLPELTPSQHKIANGILADYPFAGLQTIQELSHRMGVSAPSVSRYVNRLGYAGYHEFQRALIEELREGSRSPVELHAGVGQQVGGDFLTDYAGRLSRIVQLMASTVPHGQLAAVVELLGDRSRKVFLRGGRVSDCFARYLSIHLQQIRDGVRHMPEDPESWPDIVLRLRRQDVVVLFDFRRYQPSLEGLARAIQTQSRSTIVLITDKWQSPIARYGARVVALPIDVDTAWDTSACPMAFIEAAIVMVAEQHWPTAQSRIQCWDSVRRNLVAAVEVSGDGHEA